MTTHYVIGIDLIDTRCQVAGPVDGADIDTARDATADMVRSLRGNPTDTLGLRVYTVKSENPESAWKRLFEEIPALAELELETSR